MAARGQTRNRHMEADTKASLIGDIGKDVSKNLRTWREAEKALHAIADEEDKRIKAGDAIPESFDTATLDAIGLQSKAIEGLLSLRSQNLGEAIAKLNIWFANDLGTATDVSMMTVSERLACQAVRELNALTGFSETLD